MTACAIVVNFCGVVNKMESSLLPEYVNDLFQECVDDNVSLPQIGAKNVGCQQRRHEVAADT